MQFYTTTDIPSNLAKRSYAAGIARIMPNGGAPLFALSGYAHKKTAAQISHGYWTKTAVFPSVTIDGAHGSGATTIAVDDSSEITVGTLLRHQPAYSGTQAVWATLAETMLVTAINSAT